MSALKAFTQESRDQIVKSIVNTSTAKQSFSFSKQKRFYTNNSNCPYISYNNETSKDYKKGNPGFGMAQRKVFDSHSEAPSSWKYQPKIIQNKHSINIAKGRQQILANSYMNRTLTKNPGPGNYERGQQKSVSYTMRPQTAKDKNYFIQNKQQAVKPGPGAYQGGNSNLIGKNIVSKFKSSLLGGTAMLSRNHRFKTEADRSPCSWNYNKSVRQMKKAGGKIGSEDRYAFTDKAAISSFTPGPGNYKMPSQFGHYKKINNLI